MRDGVSGKHCPSEDCISREAVMEYIKNCTIDLGYENGTNIVIDAISNLPSVQPKPKTGHWIRHETDYGIPLRECSACREWFEWNMPKSSFCPNCGAKMESENKE